MSKRSTKQKIKELKIELRGLERRAPSYRVETPNGSFFGTAKHSHAGARRTDNRVSNTEMRLYQSIRELKAEINELEDSLPKSSIPCSIL